MAESLQRHPRLSLSGQTNLDKWHPMPLSVSRSRDNRRREHHGVKMVYAWSGNVTTAVVMISLVVCFSWIPVLIALSLYQHGSHRFRAYFERKGWVAPVKPDVEVARQQKAPEIRKPRPVVHPRRGLGLERSPSTRTYNSLASYEPLRRWDTASSWDPIRRWDSNLTIAEPPSSRPRNNSVRSNFSRPSSIRSVAGGNFRPHPQAGVIQVPARSRRPSVNSAYSNQGVAYQVDNAYYDTTPLPAQSLNLVSAGYAKSISGRSQHDSDSSGRYGKPGSSRSPTDSDSPDGHATPIILRSSHGSDSPGSFSKPRSRSQSRVETRVESPADYSRPISRSQHSTDSPTHFSKPGSRSQSQQGSDSPRNFSNPRSRSQSRVVDSAGGLEAKSISGRSRQDSDASGGYAKSILSPSRQSSDRDSPGDSGHSGRGGKSLDISRSPPEEEADVPYFQQAYFHEPRGSRQVLALPQIPRMPPPRRASLHARTAQRPAWLDTPYAM